MVSITATVSPFSGSSNWKPSFSFSYAVPMPRLVLPPFPAGVSAQPASRQMQSSEAVKTANNFFIRKPLSYSAIVTSMVEMVTGTTGLSAEVVWTPAMSSTTSIPSTT